MKPVGTLLALGGLVTGLVAARLWYQASQPGEITTLTDAFGDTGETPLALASAESMQASARLNQRATFWTAIAVALSTASSLAGSF